jgi:hypothetical protein
MQLYIDVIMQGVSKSISGFDPRSIPGCSLWLDGADQGSMTLSGSSVTTWKDKSGNGRNLTASGSYPTITSNGVLFNGATPNVLSNATGFAAVNGINSFVVFNSTVASTRQRVFLYTYTGQKLGYTVLSLAQLAVMVLLVIRQTLRMYMEEIRIQALRSFRTQKTVLKLNILQPIQSARVHRHSF